MICETHVVLVLNACHAEWVRQAFSGTLLIPRYTRDIDILRTWSMDIRAILAAAAADES